MQYKWGAYCNTNGRSTDSISLSSERRGTNNTAIQIRGVLQCKLEVYCDTFLRSSLIPLSVFFSFPVLFWCRFYPRFFVVTRAFGGSKKHSFDGQKAWAENSKTRERSLFGAKTSAEKGRNAEKLPFFWPFHALSGTGDSQRDSRESIRANHSQLKALFLQRVRPIRTNHSIRTIRANHPIRANRANQFARITPLSPCFLGKKHGKGDQGSAGWLGFLTFFWTSRDAQNTCRVKSQGRHMT